MSAARDGVAPLRLAYLDGLRAVAAVYVVLFHAVLGFVRPSGDGPWRVFRRAFAFGHEAVAIFIVLSGYCLMLPVVQKDPERLTVDVPRFIRRRALRILPPYLVALLGSLALLALVPELRARTGTIWDDTLPGLEVAPVVSHLLLVHNWFPSVSVQINGPLWSVATEWQIYFFFPLVLLPAWRRAGALAALASALVLGYLPLWLAPAAASAAIPWYLVLFTFGMAAALLELAPSARAMRDAVPWGSVAAFGCAGCAVFGLVGARVWFRYQPLTDVLVGLATASLLVYLTRRSLRSSGPRGVLLGVLESAPVVLVGRFSYSLYLTHLPLLALCFTGLGSLGLGPVAFAVSLVGLGVLGSLLFAYAFHLAFERPFLTRR